MTKPPKKPKGNSGLLFTLNQSSDTRKAIIAQPYECVLILETEGFGGGGFIVVPQKGQNAASGVETAFPHLGQNFAAKSVSEILYVFSNLNTTAKYAFRYIRKR
jgi:hypothetical protein